MIEEVTTDSFSERVTRCDIPVVVDFYAEWCQPCHQIAPALEALAQQYDGAVRFTKVDIDAEPELAAAYRVSSIPAVLRFDSGVPTAWSLGAKPGYVLEKELKLERVAKGAAVGASGKAAQRAAPSLVQALRSWLSK